MSPPFTVFYPLGHCYQRRLFSGSSPLHLSTIYQGKNTFFFIQMIIFVPSLFKAV
jgi:hypothetical protein